MLQGLVPVQGLGAAQVEIPLIDAGSFDDGGETLQYSADLLALGTARLARHRHAHGVGTQPHCLGDRHGGAHAELARFIRCGADDAAAFARTTDDQERSLAGSIGIDHARNRHEEGVSVGEEDAAGRGGQAGA
jgi:hypothetical protein